MSPDPSAWSWPWSSASPSNMDDLLASLDVASVVNGTADSLHSVLRTYDWLLGLGDDRVKDWPLMASPAPTLAIAALYVWLCTAGKRLLLPAGGLSLSLRPLLLAYNVACILLNLYIARELWVTTREFSMVCEPVDYSTAAGPMRVAAALWWYYASKLFEMLDSVFFILRGKTSQLTFLHIYHHSSMFCLWWIGVKYVAGGSSVFGALFNSAVHVLMYSYYFLAALGPAYRRYLGWKQHLTLVQMVQFVAAIVMGVNALRVQCNFPLWMQYAMIAYMVSFLVLFSNFYLKAYIQGKKRPAHSLNGGQQQQQQDGNANGNGNGKRAARFRGQRKKLHKQ